MAGNKTAIEPSSNIDDQRQEKNRLISETIAAGASKNELSLFLYQCNRTGLDPLTRQIYFIRMNGRLMIQASIDGLRVVAQRSKEYAGQDEPVFTMAQNGGDLEKCVITVYKFGPSKERYPAAVGVAYMKEYARPGKDGKPSMWDKMPHTMLAKCAEALALRKAFPQDLSGLYAAEEMDQAKPMVEKTITVEQSGPSDDNTAEAEQIEMESVAISAWNKQIEAVENPATLKMLESRIMSSNLTDDQKVELLDRIADKLGKITEHQTNG